MVRKSGPIRSIKELLFSFRKEDWSDLPHFWVSPELNWFVFLLLVAAITVIINVVWEPLPSNIREGSIATHDIRSDRDYVIVDKEATQKLREAAEKKVLPVFLYDKAYAEDVSDKVEEAFAVVRARYKELSLFIEDENGEGKEVGLLPSQVEELRTLFTDTLGVSVSVRDFEKLVEARFGQDLEQSLKETLKEHLQKPIVEDGEILESFRESGIHLLVEGKEEESQILKGRSLDSIMTLEAAEKGLKLAKAGQVPDQETRESLIIIAKSFMVPTAVYSAEETENRRQASVAEVEDVLIRIQEGESIVRRGDRFEPKDISIIEGIKDAKAKRNFLWKFVGTALFVFCFLLGLYVFAARFLYRFRPSHKDLICMGFGLLLVLGSVRIGLSVLHAIRDTIHFDIPLSALFYVLPVAAGPMVIRMIRNSQEAFIFAIASSVLVALTPDMEISYIMYYLLGGIVGAGALNRADSRGALWKAGLLTGVFQMILVISFELIRSIQIMVALDVYYIAWNMGAGLLGGLFAALVTQAFAGLAESVFGYVTDIKLLELSSLDHPLLREMIVRAPGTYHHSHLVGTLAESACRAIGANGLFARVASYFHDIGKIKKADYFVENQEPGENRHENLQPSMSALIIQNHVKDGIDLGLKYRLPQPIVDIIPQHQGTKLIHYFYSKAKENENPAVSTVSEKDYRYPGPKPQTREAGVILLSDSVEAAIRSLPDKSPTKIRAMVEKIINMNFTDAQLDECELTLRDLHDIGDIFTGILVGIYHKRVEYPDLPASEKKRLRQGIHGEQNRHTEQQSNADTSPKEAQKVTHHNLRDISRRS